MSKNIRKHPKGYWMDVGISIGVAIGVALGPIFDNLGVGIGIGVAIGTAIGSGLEQRNKDNLRPLTEQERIRQKRSITIGLVLSTILAVALTIVYIMQSR
jgi:ABC-type Mn2+/Zn2+ transport system permease subunit